MNGLFSKFFSFTCIQNLILKQFIKVYLQPTENSPLKKTKGKIAWKYYHNSFWWKDRQDTDNDWNLQGEHVLEPGISNTEQDTDVY